MPFRNPIIGGASKLIREAIQSPNYSPGTTGWTINKDGSAEFSNVVIRGTTVTAEEISLILDNPFTEAMFVSVSGDANARFRLRADGQMEWGTGGVGPRDTRLERISAGVLGTEGDFQFTIAGGGLRIAEGANATMGASTLVAGTVTVNNTLITANTRIFLTGQNSSGTHGELTVSARVAGTSFTITSSSATDTRSVAWLLIEPV